MTSNMVGMHTWVYSRPVNMSSREIQEVVKEATTTTSAASATNETRSSTGAVSKGRGNYSFEVDWWKEDRQYLGNELPLRIVGCLLGIIA